LALSDSRAVRSRDRERVAAIMVFDESLDS
jgi:hypothetical protein